MIPDTTSTGTATKIIVVGYGYPGRDATPDEDKGALAVYSALEQVFRDSKSGPIILLAGPRGIMKATRDKQIELGQPSMVAAQSLWHAYKNNCHVYCLPLNDHSPALLPWRAAFENTRTVTAKDDSILGSILQAITTPQECLSISELEMIWQDVMVLLQHEDNKKTL